MPFKIIEDDIRKIKVDAIVNAANTNLTMGGGVSRAIFKGAGVRKLKAACRKLGPIKTGEAVITPGFALPAKYIIHTAGPVYAAYEEKEAEELLRLAYENSLKLAVAKNLQSIAFPLISSGIYGYPKQEALQVAAETIKGFLDKNDLDVTLVIYDKASFQPNPKNLAQLEKYLKDHYIGPEFEISYSIKSVKLSDHISEYRKFEKEEGDTAVQLTKSLPKSSLPPLSAPVPVSDSLEHLIGNLDEPFSAMLFRIIDAKNFLDPEVYARANLDRRLFSKIRGNFDYRPKKNTVLALAVGLKLSMEESRDFLARAGYAFSRADKSDVIIEYFINNGNYNIWEINEMLFTYDQPILGAQVR